MLVPLYELNLRPSTSITALLILIIVVAKVHQLAHATAEAMAKMIQRTLIIFAGVETELETVVLVRILVLVLFVPNEVPIPR